MISKYHNLVVSLACRTIAPFIFLFGLYVIMFGHYGPGGGFQGGTILAAGVILLRMSLGREATIKKFPPQLSLILGAIGLTLFKPLMARIFDRDLRVLQSLVRAATA